MLIQIRKLILTGMIFGTMGSQLSCTLTQKAQRCHPTYAFNRGHSDASSGNVSRSGMSEGQICDGTYNAENFKRDYLAGFQRKKDELCTEETVRQLASEDAKVGHEQAELENMRVCFEGGLDQTRFKQIYRQTFSEVFCSPSRASEMAQSDAKAYAPARLEIFQGKCSKSSKKLAEESYQEAYQKELYSACMLTNIYAQGTEDARARRSLSVEIKKLLVCPHMNQKEILEFYSRAFHDASNAMMEEERLDREKERLEIEKKQLLELEDQRYRDRERLENERERLEVEKKKLLELEHQRDKH